MIRTTLLTRRFPPQTCGVGDYTLRLAESLTQQGEQVTVFTGPYPGARPPQVWVVELPMSGWRDLRPLLRAILAENPDRVQFEYSAYGWGRWGIAFWVNALLLSLRRSGVPVTLGLHELPIRLRQHPLQLPFILLQWLHVGLLVAAADTVAVNLAERVRLLRRMFFWWRSRILYRPNASTIPMVFCTPEERRALREARGARPDDLVVATFGMFHAGKNLEALLDAVACVRRNCSVRLWLLGDSRAAAPAYIEELRERANSLGIGDAVFWSGHLDSADISAHLQACDVFVLPQADGHLTRSSAFMAAAAHGLPVIAVRNPANQQEFTHGRDVWLTERSSGREFAAALEEFLGDPQLSASLGGNLRKLYEEKFDWAVATRPQGGISSAPVIREELVAPESNLEKAQVRKA